MTTDSLGSSSSFSSEFASISYEANIDSELLSDAIIDATAGTIISDLAEIIVDYLPLGLIFGENEWKYRGHQVSKAPDLPKDFDKTWLSLCLFTRKKVRDSYILVYIPEKVDGDFKFSLFQLWQLLRYSFPNLAFDSADWHNTCGPAHEKIKRVEKSGWVLMTKDVIPNSTGKSYKEQQAIISDITGSSLRNCQVPTAMEAMVCRVAQYWLNGNRLSDEPKMYTRCREEFDGYQVVVGNVSLSGRFILGTVNSSWVTKQLGMAVMQKL